MEIKTPRTYIATSSVLCDVCEKECIENYIPISCIWGYGSPNDGDQTSCELCESCWNKVEAFIVNELKGKVRKEVM